LKVSKKIGEKSVVILDEAEGEKVENSVREEERRER